ncbi:hypothetical protein FB45DRAFT_929010 [Roridomyces roridus]|uniref:Uncharacterized protein n=1 Tax=Roridomyces roridus TaxID=1738132 RepID=A0AAD7BHP6_9AGAR|nr:hypothetical protein FB45DRAFT_929010 [Roridomyces roridus]
MSFSFSKSTGHSRHPTHTLSIIVTYTPAQAEIIYSLGLGLDLDRVARGLRSDLNRFKLPHPPRAHINVPTRDGIEFFYSTRQNSVLFLPFLSFWGKTNADAWQHLYSIVIDRFDLTLFEEHELRMHGHGPSHRKSYKLKDTPETRLLKAECFIEEMELEVSKTVRLPFHPIIPIPIPAAPDPFTWRPELESPFQQQRHNNRSLSPPPRRRDRENSFTRDSPPPYRSLRRRLDSSEDSVSVSSYPRDRKTSKSKKNGLKKKKSSNSLKRKKPEPPKPIIYSESPPDGQNPSVHSDYYGPALPPTPPLPLPNENEMEMETKANMVARLTRGYWDLRSQMREEAGRGMGIQALLQRPEPNSDLSSLTEQVNQMTVLVEEERAALRMAEDVLEDVLRECAEPLVVPALLDLVLRYDWED